MVYTKGAKACVAVLLVTAACGGTGSGDGGSTTTGDASTSGEITLTTIPLPVDSSGSSDGAGTTAAGTTTADTTGPGMTGTTGPADSSGGSSSSGTPGQTTDDGGPTVYEVEWCNLQYPPMVDVAVSEPFTVYAHVYSAGLTDQTTATDPAPELVVEVGYSVDGSDPSTGVGAPWTWEMAMPNVGYGPGSPAYMVNNDEYQHDLVIDVAGIYDYAARVSGDSGANWVYCDLDGLTEGGYTTDQAGHAEVGQ
jgi:hypothetical protein